ncbi:MAG: sulfotransferase [Gemmataceae bacterium]|nr:sulfotransferase [Gemmataceae bacterium]
MLHLKDLDWTWDVDQAWRPSGGAPIQTLPPPTLPRVESPKPAPASWSWSSTWQSVAASLSPGLLSGVRLGTWLRVLQENRLEIDPPYWARAFLVTLGAMAQTGLSWLEDHYFSQAVQRAKILPPLFILGLPRSGTTHLHNLLSRDKRFAYPTMFEVLFPNTFLLTEPILAGIVDRLIGHRRPMDNVRFGAAEPQEDEWAMPSLIGRSCLLACAFPRNRDLHDRYLTLRELGEEERRAWQTALLQFVRKLSYKHSKPLVLKSPGHTGRIRYLLELFPDARFVLIRRNPYTIFQSAWHTLKVTGAEATYQAIPASSCPETILRSYRLLFEAYFEDRSLIPPGRLHEVSFEDLEADPMGEMRRLYDQLNLPTFDDFVPHLRDYLQSLRGYTKNCHKPLESDVKQRVASEWSRLFDEWGYSRGDSQAG